MSLLRTAVSGTVRAETRLFSTTSVALRAKKLDPSIPEPPKRGNSAYTLFFKDFFEKNRSRFIDPATTRLKITDLARECGSAWQALPYNEVQKYTEISKKARAQADAAYEKYYNSLTDAQRRAYAAAKGKPLQVPGGRANYNKRLDEEPGNPGRPIGAFFLFLREVTPRIAKEGEVQSLSKMEQQRVIAKRAGEEWNKLSQAEKDSYKEKNKELREKYNAWKEGQKGQ